MHDFTMPQWAIDRVIARRGSEHPNADMDPARTALVVIDLQNAFMLEGVGREGEGTQAYRKCATRRGGACAWR